MYSKKRLLNSLSITSVCVLASIESLASPIRQDDDFFDLMYCEREQQQYPHAEGNFLSSSLPSTNSSSNMHDLKAVSAESEDEESERRSKESIASADSKSLAAEESDGLIPPPPVQIIQIKGVNTEEEYTKPKKRQATEKPTNEELKQNKDLEDALKRGQSVLDIGGKRTLDQIELYKRILKNNGLMESFKKGREKVPAWSSVSEDGHKLDTIFEGAMRGRSFRQLSVELGFNGTLVSTFFYTHPDFKEVKEFILNMGSNLTPGIQRSSTQTQEWLSLTTDEQNKDLEDALKRGQSVLDICGERNLDQIELYKRILKNNGLMESFKKGREKAPAWSVSEDGHKLDTIFEGAMGGPSFRQLSVELGSYKKRVNYFFSTHPHFKEVKKFILNMGSNLTPGIQNNDVEAHLIHIPQSSSTQPTRTIIPKNPSPYSQKPMGLQFLDLRTPQNIPPPIPVLPVPTMKTTKTIASPIDVLWDKQLQNSHYPQEPISSHVLLSMPPLNPLSPHPTAVTQTWITPQQILGNLPQTQVTEEPFNFGFGLMDGSDDTFPAFPPPRKPLVYGQELTQTKTTTTTANRITSGPTTITNKEKKRKPLQSDGTNKRRRVETAQSPVTSISTPR